MPDTLYMVVFDDEMGLCCPMSHDTECEGALEANDGPVALFGSRKAARHAINVSKANAKLRRLQGLSVNEDFGEASHCLKITEARVLAAETKE